MAVLPYRIKLWKGMLLKLYNRDRVLELARAVHLTKRAALSRKRARAACTSLALDTSGNLRTLRRRLMLHIAVFNGGEDKDTQLGPAAMRASLPSAHQPGFPPNPLCPSRSAGPCSLKLTPSMAGDQTGVDACRSLGPLPPRARFPRLATRAPVRPLAAHFVRASPLRRGCAVLAVRAAPPTGWRRPPSSTSRSSHVRLRVYR